MAWQCSGTSNLELVNNLRKAGIITSQRIADAMKATDRKFYVRAGTDAYEDSPQVIGFGATISAPHMHAHALEHVFPYLKPGASVLDVGIGIDHIKNLTEMSESNLRADKHGSVLASGAIQIVTGDGRKGFSPGAPYDVIHVGAASPTMPQSLLQQLKAPGRMFVPVGTQTQDVWCVDKDRQGEVKMQKLVRYVPLTDAPDQVHVP
ncbi:MAG: hypothetical protein CYPHOPRED_000180 [Cyphobasidiales sp. Tagirdzhanova-0007]|nr:MAG: hypothetical protein CYPHOPRED_000180 [Cyphobasidiales sp. Tagirdzhanova-0007]